MKLSLVLSVLVCGFMAHAQTPAAPAAPMDPAAKAAVKAAAAKDTTAITSGCTAEITAGNCGNEKIGTGLLKCLGAYRKAGNKFSPGCQAAMKQTGADLKAAKAQ